MFVKSLYRVLRDTALQRLHRFPLARSRIRGNLIHVFSLSPPRWASRSYFSSPAALYLTSPTSLHCQRRLSALRRSKYSMRDWIQDGSPSKPCRPVSPRTCFSPPVRHFCSHSFTAQQTKLNLSAPGEVRIERPSGICESLTTVSLR